MHVRQLQTECMVCINGNGARYLQFADIQLAPDVIVSSILMELFKYFERNVDRMLKPLIRPKPNVFLHSFFWVQKEKEDRIVDLWNLYLYLISN
jgi:hypothetical protein